MQIMHVLQGLIFTSWNRCNEQGIRRCRMMKSKVFSSVKEPCVPDFTMDIYTARARRCSCLIISTPKGINVMAVTNILHHHHHPHPVHHRQKGFNWTFRKPFSYGRRMHAEHCCNQQLFWSWYVAYVSVLIGSNKSPSLELTYKFVDGLSMESKSA